MTFYIILAFSVFFISLVGTKLVILTIRNKAVSPDIAIIAGKKHPPPAENGGIALVFSVIIGFLGAETHYVIIGCIFFLMGLSMLANISFLPKTLKFIGEIIAVIAALSIFPAHIFSEEMPYLFDRTIAGLLFLLIIHSFDKMEKAEAVIPIEVVTIGFGLCGIGILTDNFFSPLSLQSLLFATAGCGFLWWNYYPAKVMIGKIASVPMGFVAGYLLILAASNGYIIASIILPAYFLAETAIMSFRKKSTKNPYGNQPICLYAIKNLGKPERALRLITGINMFLIFIAAQTIIYPEINIFNLTIAYMMVFAIIHILTKIKLNIK